MMPATLLYGGLLGLLFVVLSGLVSLERLRLKTRGPATAHPSLYRASRAHGNLAESAALAVALLAVCELSHGDSRVVHALGGSYLLARLLHAPSWFIKRPILRTTGATLTLLSLLCLGGYALWLRLR